MTAVGSHSQCTAIPNSTKSANESNQFLRGTRFQEPHEPQFLRYAYIELYHLSVGPRSRYSVQADGVTVWSCRPTQHTNSPMNTDGPLHWSEARRQMATDPWSTTNLVLPDLD